MATQADAALAERTLDPEDWEQLRALGHRMLDDMLDQQAGLREQPAWQPVPASVAASLTAQPVPLRPTPVEAVYDEFLTHILPYTSGNRHPRAWGWVRGNGTPLGMLADMLASGINAHAAGGQQASTLVEDQVLAWLAELMGMPPATTGLLTTGGTMANLLGIAIARNLRAGYDVRQHGIDPARARLLVYGSTETHAWSQKAVELLGLGGENFRRIPVDAGYRIDTVALRAQLAADLAAGHRPIALIGNCGTVNTGAIDDLPTLAELCREHDLWLHVDGAFGALLKLSPRYAPLVRGVELADSLAFDLHKWIDLPFEIGCLLVREPGAPAAAFATRASYLEDPSLQNATTEEGPGPRMERGEPRGMLAGGLAFADRGIELTRSFRALKAWMSFRTHGVETYAALIEQNLEQTKHLERLIQSHPELELLAPRAANVVCFRYVSAEMRDSSGVQSEAALNALNRELVLRLQESGKYVVSGTILRGRYALRVANVNHRSRMEDFDALVRDTVLLGRAVAAAWE